MRLAVTSDNHGYPIQIPACDVFIHCGDITARGIFTETLKFANWLAKQDQVGHSIIVPGNHDRLFYENPRMAQDIFSGGGAGKVDILIDRGIEIDGHTFWGSPWTPPFMKWWFMAEEDKLRQYYAMIPPKLDVLITHGPPRGVLDEINGEHVGSLALGEVYSGRAIKNHFFGHIHAQGGKHINIGGVIDIYNVAACNEAYELVRQPLVVDI